MGRNNSSGDRKPSQRKNRNNRSGNNNSQSKGPNKKSSSSKKRSFNKNRRPKKLTPSRIIAKYQNHLEQYLTARKKFHDVHGHKNDQQVGKAQRVYEQALKTLRDFEKNLEDWQRDVLAEFLAAYPEDRQYSTEHNLPPVGDTVSFVGEFEDPHLLPTQKSEAWSEDTEDTSGTMADYYAYKGITPPEEIPENANSDNTKN
ncbi:MAG: hypothetical protein CME65_07905 [Halobacteriovoraceae bacterium]|nr:hypothetical protein [Halobacteriovoraceae bacterium]|tara:strand:- start:15683 stop:16285 length:603 start_codon:yes stop_codon:yes gene_type:complete